MRGRMRPYLPELTIRDYNTYQWYLRGVRRQLYTTYGIYPCYYGLRYNGVLFALLADSLAGRPATCKRMRVPGTLLWQNMMCQTQGIRLAAQVEILLSWHRIQDAQWADLPVGKKVRRVVDTVLLRRAYKKAAAENPALERIFVQERDQANVQMALNAKNYLLAAEPKGNLYGALYSVLATDDPNQRKSMHYIGSCIGRAAYLLDKAESFSRDKDKKRYNIFLVNGIDDRNAARENARRNGLSDVMECVAANVFDLLPALEKEPKRYDFIILDPPAFTKSRKTVKSAERGYKDINLRALRLLPRGGYFATASCSHFMPSELFEKMLRSAALDAGVELRQIEARQQSPDHPILWNVPETDYLKFYLFQVV